MALIASEDEIQEGWYHKYIRSILKSGPIPEHVAFIMDGNRRYAKSKNLKTLQGHTEGFDKIGYVLKWCQELGVKQVSCFAFSLENFKRKKQEVDDLMNLARDKFKVILDKKDKLDKYGVCIRFVGDLKRLPDDLQQVINQLHSQTKSNSKCYLNICVAYTSRFEMMEGIKLLAEGVQNNQILSSDIDEYLFSKSLKISKVDLLVRTSGEIRLSDFLMWQNSFSLFSFVKNNWPDLTTWNFYLAILFYQQAYKSKTMIEEKFLSSTPEEVLTETEKEEKKQRVNTFLSNKTK